MIDSSKFPIVEAGLKWVQGKSIVNSISLKVRKAGLLVYLVVCLTLTPYHVFVVLFNPW